MVWLDNSRIIAIFSVVFLHSAAGAVTGNEVGTTYWWIGNYYDSMVRWCVPVFVMISGSLLLDPKKTEPIKTFYIKRMSKIIIPIIFWSLFFLFWAYLKGIVGGQHLSASDLFKKLVIGRPHYHMWFLYMIISLYLFTPFFRKIVSNSSRFEISIFVILTLALSAINAIKNQVLPGGYSPFFYWFLSYIPFFFLGYLIREDKNDYSPKLLWVVFITSVVLTAVGCYLLAVRVSLEAGMYFYGYLSVTVIPMSISVMYLLKLWTKPVINSEITKRLSALTLGVYLIHPVFLETFSFLGFGARDFNPLWSVPVIAILVSTLSLLTAYMISKFRHLERII
jgi:surface polysaccharide O-acyltransferase-like enzyme